MDTKKAKSNKTGKESAVKSFVMFAIALLFWGGVFFLLRPFVRKMSYEDLANLSAGLLVVWTCSMVAAIAVVALSSYGIVRGRWIAIPAYFFVGFWVMSSFGAIFCPLAALQRDFEKPCSGVVIEKGVLDHDWRIFGAEALGTSRYVVVEDASGHRFKKHIPGAEWRVIEVDDHIEKKAVSEPLLINGKVPSVPAVEKLIDQIF